MGFQLPTSSNAGFQPSTEVNYFPGPSAKNTLALAFFQLHLWRQRHVVAEQTGQTVVQRNLVPVSIWDLWTPLYIQKNGKIPQQHLDLLVWCLEKVKNIFSQIVWWWLTNVQSKKIAKKKTKPRTSYQLVEGAGLSAPSTVGERNERGLTKLKGWYVKFSTEILEPVGHPDFCSKSR